MALQTALNLLDLFIFETGTTPRRWDLAWYFCRPTEVLLSLGKVNDVRAAYGDALEIFETIGLQPRDWLV